MCHKSLQDQVLDSLDSATPHCLCDAPMREVTEADERRLGLRAWICDACKIERQTTAGEDDPPADVCGTESVAGSEERIRAYRRRVKQKKAVFHPCDNPGKMPPRDRPPRTEHDPVESGVRRRRNRFEVRIADGRGGLVRVGLYASREEAIAARDAALAAKGSGAGDEAA